MRTNQKVLVFVVAYNAQKTLSQVLDRIPLSELNCQLEILIIDDSSNDDTFEVGLRYLQSRKTNVPLQVLKNPVNQGYGGNQKLGYQYAIENGFDHVVLLHGDGQYAPEKMSAILSPLLEGNADAVFGSRMLDKLGALRGNMPLYKFLGNKILTGFQNLFLKASLSEFHSGYRAYSVKALDQIPFQLNTNDFHFDTEIIIQFLRRGLRIKEVAIPTYYGEEICHVNGMKYAKDVICSTLLSCAQSFGIWYSKKFDVGPVTTDRYQCKLGYPSSHSMAVKLVPPSSRVLDIGCGSGFIAQELKLSKGCSVVGIDADKKNSFVCQQRMDAFHTLDISSEIIPEEIGTHYDVLLLLDIIEHIKSPEKLLEKFRQRFGSVRPKVIITTPNIAFLPVRLSLLFGAFNYGPRGILDLTHTRLFTFSSLRTMLRESGMAIEGIEGVPAPFPLVFGESRFSNLLVKVNKILIRLWPGLFSYQILAKGEFSPTVESLLEETKKNSNNLARIMNY